MGRADSILGRFPAHFEALGRARPCVRRLALARDLDVQAPRLRGDPPFASVADADVLPDLLLIGAARHHGVVARVADHAVRARGLLKDLRRPPTKRRGTAAPGCSRSGASRAASRSLRCLPIRTKTAPGRAHRRGRRATAAARLIAAATEASSRQTQTTRRAPASPHDPHRGERQRHRAGAVRRGERA